MTESSLEKRDKMLMDKGRSSYEFQVLVEECKESIRQSKIRKLKEKKEADRIKKNSTINMFS